MQYINRKMAVAAIAVLLGTSSCGFFDVEEVADPNFPSLDAVLNNATRTQLDALAVGVEASYRLHHTTNAPYNWLTGTLGREVIVLANTESRWYGELQGTRSTLDNAAYYNAYYIPLSQMRRAAQVYRESANNSPVLTAEERQGVAGFTHTYEALAKLLILNLQGENGIRINLDDIRRPGPFVTEAEGYRDILRLLDLGAEELDQAGTGIGFTLSAVSKNAPSGIAGADFDTPATFKRFNRGLAARVALYQKDYVAAARALEQSFYDPAAALTIGPKLTFNPATAGDQANPYFQPANNTGSTVVVVPQNFVREAETGDVRVSKARLRDTPPGPRSTGGISSAYEAELFTTITAPLDIITNEELILIAAEVKANRGNLAGALEDVNVIRTRAGQLNALPAGSFTNLEVAIDEILKQRRYSLFYEGHRFIDLRRTGRLQPVVSPARTEPYVTPIQTLEFSTTPYRLFRNMPRPAAEDAWDTINP